MCVLLVRGTMSIAEECGCATSGVLDLPLSGPKYAAGAIKPRSVVTAAKWVRHGQTQGQLVHMEHRQGCMQRCAEMCRDVASGGILRIESD